MIWEELPLKREVFELLRNGRHVFSADGECFRALCDNEELYREFFEALGFSLERHNRDFFYFKGTGGGTFSARAAVFFFILAEWISDQGESVTESLFETALPLDKLPHLDRDRYRKYMVETGIDSKDSLMNLLKRMEKRGFLEFVGNGGILFKVPAYRFLDLCSEIMTEEASNGS